MPLFPFFIPADLKRELLAEFPGAQRNHNQNVQAYETLLREAVRLNGLLPANERDGRATAELLQARAVLVANDASFRAAQVALVAEGQRLVNAGRLHPDEAPRMPGLGLAPLLVLAVGAVAIGAIVAHGALGIAFFGELAEQKRRNAEAGQRLVSVRAILEDYRRRLASDPSTPAPELPGSPPAGSSFGTILAGAGGLLTLGVGLWVLSMLPKGGAK